MSRKITSEEEKAQVIIREHPDIFIKTLSGNLYCNYCNMIVNCVKRYTVIRHIQSQKHLKFESTADITLEQQFLINASNNHYKIIANVVDSANFPLCKLRHPKLNKCFIIFIV